MEPEAVVRERPVREQQGGAAIAVGAEPVQRQLHPIIGRHAAYAHS
jgi:hypothetical protein